MSKTSFKRSIKGVEHEIVNQILLAELAFNICSIIPIDPGRGPDMLPYFYNLNYCKGLIALHSLLLSKEKNEITLRNYFLQFKWEYKTSIDKEFEEAINDIRKDFNAVHSLPLRHHIAAHISQTFNHTDFANAYIIPDSLPALTEITQKLKTTFFEHTNYSLTHRSFQPIVEQTHALVKLVG